MRNTGEASKYFKFTSDLIGLSKFVEALSSVSDYSENVPGEDTELTGDDITLLNDIRMGNKDYVVSILNNAKNRGFVQPGISYTVTLEFKSDDPGIALGMPEDGTVPKIKTTGGKIISNAAITRALRKGYEQNYFKVSSDGTYNVKKYAFQFKLPKTRSVTNENFYIEFAEILKDSVSKSF